MNLQEIMDEADLLVPNSFDLPTKIRWLNEINRNFFEVVKIPKVYFFDVTKGVAVVSLTGQDVALRNIDRVMIGTTIHRSFQLEDVPAGNYGWTFDETTNALTLNPAPYLTGKGYLRYMRTATTTFLQANPQSQTPDAPTAYQESYVLGLAEKMALTLDDMAKAGNYGQLYRAYLSVAQLNHERGGRGQ